MKKLLNYFLVSALLFLSVQYCYGQQYPVFSQYYFNEMVINPAYAGSHIQLSATLMYRNQWVNFPGAPRTFSASGHMAILGSKIGVGMLINRDVIGSYTNDHFYGYYSYRLMFPNATLSFGLQAGFNILGADYSNIDLQDKLDDSFGNLVNSLKPNFGTGVFYSRKNFFAGFSVPFIINNKVAGKVESLLNGIQEARYYFIRTGAIFPINKTESVKISPSLLLRAQEGQPLNLDINNAFIFYDVFSVGVSYRNIEGIISFIDLKLSDKLHFGYSYDWTQSELNQFSNGTHEFMINYRSPIRKIHGNVECPSYYHHNK